MLYPAPHLLWWRLGRAMQEATGKTVVNQGENPGGTELMEDPCLNIRS